MFAQELAAESASAAELWAQKKRRRGSLGFHATQGRRIVDIRYTGRGRVGSTAGENSRDTNHTVSVPAEGPMAWTERTFATDSQLSCSGTNLPLGDAMTQQRDTGATAPLPAVSVETVGALAEDPRWLERVGRGVFCLMWLVPVDAVARLLFPVRVLGGWGET